MKKPHDLHAELIYLLRSMRNNGLSAKILLNNLYPNNKGSEKLSSWANELNGWVKELNDLNDLKQKK